MAEKDSEIPSVALGRLGPPELSKLLFEAYLFKYAYTSLGAVIAEKKTAQEMSQKNWSLFLNNQVLQVLLLR